MALSWLLFICGVHPCVSENDLISMSDVDVPNSHIQVATEFGSLEPPYDDTPPPVKLQYRLVQCFTLHLKAVVCIVAHL